MKQIASDTRHYIVSLINRLNQDAEKFGEWYGYDIDCPSEVRIFQRYDDGCSSSAEFSSYSSAIDALKMDIECRQ